MGTLPSVLLLTRSIFSAPMIACCDSRVDPAIITDSRAGDIMVVRNLANLVPPYRENSPFQELQAAVEVATCYHQVEHIIVMGHSRCAAIRSLMSENSAT